MLSVVQQERFLEEEVRVSSSVLSSSSAVARFLGQVETVELERAGAVCLFEL